MKKFISEIKKKKFIDFSFLNNQKKLFTWRISFLSTILVLFVIFFLISTLNDGYGFIANDSQKILNTTLLKTLAGLLCGYGLTCAGCAMQSVTKNELAGPTTLGFMPAATLGIMIYQIIQYPSIPLMIFFAFLFAAIIFLINYLSLKFQKEYNKGYKMILIGVIIGAFITTISSIITTYVPIANQTILPWIGTISTNLSWDYFKYCAPLIIIGILMITWKTKTFNIVENDKELANSLGVNYELTFWISGIGSILITVSSVVLIGSVTMIGIVIPHLVRMIFRTRNYKFIMPVSGILCATIIIFSLWINSKYTLGLNLFSTIISVPLFIYIISRRNKNV